MRRNYELADPLDRESSRGGISADGLSYSVANDIGKLRGQAMAEYDARSKDPRNDIWGKTLEEDLPENLRAELLDPFNPSPVRRAAPAAASRMPAPRTYKTKGPHGEDQVVQLDPMSGQAKVVFSAPAPPMKDPRDMVDYRTLDNSIRMAQKNLSETDPSNVTRYTAARKILDEAFAARDAARTASRASAPALEQPLASPVEQYNQIAPAPAAASAPTPQVFIGEPGVTNLAPPEGAGASRNGRLPLDIARQLLERTKGNRELARKYALEMGFSVE